MQSGQGSSVVKRRRRQLGTAHARRRARNYSNSVTRELPNEDIVDELRSSHESSLVEGSAAFLKSLLCETDGFDSEITRLKNETRKEVSESESIKSKIH